MCSTHRALGTAQARLTCSSIKKCGHTLMLWHWARCATFNQGVMPPMRATSTCTMWQGLRLQIVGKLAQAVQRLANRNRDGRVPAQVLVGHDAVRRHGLFEPGQLQM